MACGRQAFENKECTRGRACVNLHCIAAVLTAGAAPLPAAWRPGTFRLWMCMWVCPWCQVIQCACVLAHRSCGSVTSCLPLRHATVPGRHSASSAQAAPSSGQAQRLVQVYSAGEGRGSGK